MICGLAIGHSVTAVLVHEERGVVARSSFELPVGAIRAEVLARSVMGALESLGDREHCRCAGVAFAPQDFVLADQLLRDGRFDPHLPLIGGLKISFSGSEIESLLPIFAGGRNKAWLMLDDPVRLYAEQCEEGESIEVTDEKGKRRVMHHRMTPDILEPLRVLISRLGLVESFDDIRDLARIGKDSAGVRFARRSRQPVAGEEGIASSRDDGFAIMGLKDGVRRPQVARAALEAVGLEVRAALADLAGEAVVEELYAVGSYARSDELTGVIADMMAAPVIRVAEQNAVAWGAAYLAARAESVMLLRPERHRSNPSMPAARRNEIFARWAVARTRES
ncbi:MAG: FGGY-family carbohydrate kinase [Candidatus Hydrogenedentota bacterium]